jgi:uncharacterized protein involved in response to NO
MLAKASHLFAYGFRSQFLLVGLAGVVLVPLWALSYFAGTPLGATDWPPMLWHAHEMLYGFIVPAIAGFLLTAVPSWTGQKGFAGFPLVLLTLLWLVARIMVSSSQWWPAWLVAGADLAFLPVLAVLVGRPLLRERNRNTPLLLVLVALWACNLWFHRAKSGLDPPQAMRALVVGIDIVLLLATVIGGRIVPAFTNSGLRERAAPDAAAAANVVAKASPTLTVLAVTAMGLIIVVDAWRPDGVVAAVLAAAAAAIHTVRLARWGTRHTLRQPIVWVLHLGYAWLPLGLALKATALWSTPEPGPAFAAFWLHALTIGGLATLIMAVMTRASLGHTGRPLVVDPLITLAYALLSAAAVIRVFGLGALGMNYLAVIAISALCWTTALALFLAVYVPILVGPRADGRPG